MPLDQVNRNLQSGGIESVSWKDAPPGATIEGTILDGDELQDTRLNPKDPNNPIPVYWDEETKKRPKMIVFLDLQTSWRTSEEDDGRRRVYIRGNAWTATQAALREAGAEGLEVGGYFSLTLTGRGTPSSPGMTPPNLFTARYRKPAIGAGTMAQQPPVPPVNGAAGTQPQPAPQPQPQPQPAPQPQPQPAGVGAQAWGQAPAAPQTWPQPSADQSAAPNAGHTVQQAWPAQQPPAQQTWPQPPAEQSRPLV